MASEALKKLSIDLAGGQQPAAQTPTTPIPELASPANPVAYSNQYSAPIGPTKDGAPMPANIEYGVRMPETSPPKEKAAKPLGNESAAAAYQQAAQPGYLTMPQNGSVVDLLNLAGQNSSFDAREQLAAQYGIAGYRGTAGQNKELSKNFLEAFNAQKGKDAPQSAAEAGTALDEYFKETAVDEVKDPQKAFIDAYANMNPVEANLYEQVSNLLSTQQAQTSLVDTYQQMAAASGLEELNLELADINRIMEGTEDDIRSEIEATGGFATESQVRGLSAARNKTLLREANYLQNVINSKNDYIKQVVNLTKADREALDRDLNNKLGITQMLVSMSDNMTTRARENYEMIVDQVGWEGLAQTLNGNPEQTAYVEKMFGLGKGELDLLASYKKPLTEGEELDLENQRLQNQKLRRDLNAPASSASIETQVVEINGKKKLINTQTGEIIADLSGGDDVDELQMLNTYQEMTDLQSIIDSPYLDTAVGPNPVARYSPLEYFTGGKSSFVGDVDSLASRLSLESLLQAKAKGATFGALSNQELSILSSAATPLLSNAWTVKDDNGNIIGWKVSEKDFRKQMDIINRYAKLDYVLKGGDVESAGLIEMPDGTLWYENFDGTLTNLR